MKSMKKLAILLLAIAAAGVFAAKPVGVWNGLRPERLGELVNATVFSPQWHKDKPLKISFTGKEFDKVSAVVYLHGFNQIFRFREWKKDMISKMETFVSNGGVLVILIDGAPKPPEVSTTKDMAKLLGASKFVNISGKVEIKDSSWAECGKNPKVFEHMLAPKKTQGAPAKPLIALSGLSTAKTIIGNKSGAIVAVNQLGKGKVYFINVRLTEAASSFPLPPNYVVNAEWQQYLPFAKKIHEALLEAKPALSKEKRERWEPIPLGPKAKKLVINFFIIYQ